MYALAINNNGLCWNFLVSGPVMMIDQQLGDGYISTNTLSMILHLDKIRNGIVYEVLAKSGKYLN